MGLRNLIAPIVDCLEFDDYSNDPNALNHRCYRADAISAIKLEPYFATPLKQDIAEVTYKMHYVDSVPHPMKPDQIGVWVAVKSEN